MDREAQIKSFIDFGTTSKQKKKKNQYQGYCRFHAQPMGLLRVPYTCDHCGQALCRNHAGHGLRSKKIYCPNCAPLFSKQASSEMRLVQAAEKLYQSKRTAEAENIVERLLDAFLFE